MKTIKVFQVTGANAISIQSGQNLYGKFYPDFSKGEVICLDFDKVDLFASPYFNASIGLLLRDHDLQEVLSRIKIVNLNSVGRQLLNHVIANALTFYKDD